jgi:uncharacterized protein (DUF2267 family)
VRKDEFLAQVQVAGRLADRREAERWSRAVLRALSHLAPDSETRRQFITQLPGFLKTALLADRPRALLMTREAFLQHIGAALRVHTPEAERALGAVYRVLGQAVSAGEIADFEARLPPEIAAFLGRLR